MSDERGYARVGPTDTRARRLRPRPTFLEEEGLGSRPVAQKRIAYRFPRPTDDELRALAAHYTATTGRRVWPKIWTLIALAWRAHGPDAEAVIDREYASGGIDDLLARVINATEPDVTSGPPRPSELPAGDPPAPIAFPAPPSPKTPSPRTTDLLDGLDEEVEAAMPSYFASQDRKLDVPLGTHARAHAADVDEIYDRLPYKRDQSQPYDPASTARYDRVDCRAYRDHRSSHCWDRDRWRCPECAAA